MTKRTCNRCNRPLSTRQAKYCSHACANRNAMAALSARSRQTPWATCTVEECEKPARSRTAKLCPMHYHRLYRYGTLERTTTLVARGERTLPPSHPRQPQHNPGDVIGTLTLIHRDGTHWVCRCTCGETRRATAGELNRTGEQNTCGTKVNHLSDTAEYGAAHGRVRTRRGPASNHACADCGEPAQHWSYDHLDPNERISSRGESKGCAYSLVVDHYQPRCVPCHKRYDLDMINGTRRFELEH